MLPGVKEGDRVLLIWSGITSPEKLEERVRQLNSVVGPMGKVAVEHEERLKLCEFRMVNVVKLNYVLHCHCSRFLKFKNVYRLFTVPYFFVRSSRYRASYR